MGRRDREKPGLDLCERGLKSSVAGAIYHVMNRGDRRKNIFHDEQDHVRFLKTLGEACQKTVWQVHAWCLMGNHFHLVVETPPPNLVDGMKWLLGTYTGLQGVHSNQEGAGVWEITPLGGSCLNKWRLARPCVTLDRR